MNKKISKYSKKHKYYITLNANLKEDDSIDVSIEMSDKDTGKKFNVNAHPKNNYWHYLCVVPVAGLIDRLNDNNIDIVSIYDYFVRLNKAIPSMPYTTKNIDSFDALMAIDKFITSYKADTIGSALIKGAITSRYTKTLSDLITNAKPLMYINAGNDERLYECHSIKVLNNYSVWEVISYNNIFDEDESLEGFKHYGVFESGNIMERFIKPLDGLKGIDIPVIDEYFRKLHIMDQAYVENVNDKIKYYDANNEEYQKELSRLSELSYIALMYKELVYEDKFKDILDYTLSNKCNKDLAKFFE